MNTESFQEKGRNSRSLLWLIVKKFSMKTLLSKLLTQATVSQLLRRVLLPIVLISPLLALGLFAPLQVFAHNTPKDSVPSKNERQPRLRPLSSPGLLLDESFDGTTFPPTGWGTTIVTGTTQGWSRVTSGSQPSASPHSGAGMAQFNSNLISSGDSTRLYTPILDLTGQTTPTLKYWMYHDTAWSSANDRIQIEISLDGGTNYTTVLTTTSRYDGSTGWKLHVVDLSSYIGQGNARIGFLAISAFGDNMLIDDVQIGPPGPLYSTSTMSVLPSGTVFTGQTLTYTIIISNAGDASGTATTLHDLIPPGTSYISNTASVQGGGTLTATAVAIDWSGIVIASQQITVTYQVTVTGINGFIVNAATINDPLTLGVTLITISPIAVPVYDGASKSVSPIGVITTGQTLTYTIILPNSGLVSGTNTTVHDPLPVGISYLPGSAHVQGGGILTATASSVDWSGIVTNSQSITINFQASVTAAAGSVTNTVIISDPLLLAAVTKTSGFSFNPVMFQHDQQHTGRSPYVGPSSPALVWTLPVSGTPGAPAIGADGSIYLPVGKTSNDWVDSNSVGYLYAINPNGTQKWRTTLAILPAVTAPAIAPDGTIYVHGNGSEGNIAAIEKMYAINPDGTVKWIFEFNYGGAIFTTDWQSSPAVAPDGTIYVASMDTRLWAINPDGSIKWSRLCCTNSLASSPAIKKDGTIVVDGNGTLYAFSPNGSQIWNYAFCCTTLGQSPSIGSDGTVYFNQYDTVTSSNYLYALHSDGTFFWRYPIGSDDYSTPAIAADGTIYDASDFLYAINRNGTLKWKTNPTGGLYSNSSPLIGGDGTIYYRALAGIYDIDPDGSAQWYAYPGGFGPDVIPSPAIGSDGTLYIPAHEGSSPNSLQAYRTIRGLSLYPYSAARSGNPSTIVTYSLALTNTGNVTDSYTMTASSHAFTTTITPTILMSVTAGASRSLSITVQIPSNAVGGSIDTAIVNGTSQGDPSKTTSSTLTTTANIVRGVTLTPASMAQSSNPGATVTYTLRITNTGNAVDTFGMIISGNAWTTAAVPTVGPLASGIGANVAVSVTIPVNAAGGANDMVIITATSQSNPTKSASSFLTTTANTVHGVTLTPASAVRLGYPGIIVTYTLAVTNTGNTTDGFSLIIGGATFTTTITPTSIEALSADASQVVTVTVQIPISATGGMSDIATINAISQSDAGKTSSSTLTTKVGYRIYVPLMLRST